MGLTLVAMQSSHVGELTGSGAALYQHGRAYTGFETNPMSRMGDSLGIKSGDVLGVTELDPETSRRNRFRFYRVSGRKEEGKLWALLARVDMRKNPLWDREVAPRTVVRKKLSSIIKVLQLQSTHYELQLHTDSRGAAKVVGYQIMKATGRGRNPFFGVGLNRMATFGAIGLAFFAFDIGFQLMTDRSVTQLLFSKVGRFSLRETDLAEFAVGLGFAALGGKLGVAIYGTTFMVGKTAEWLPRPVNIDQLFG